MPTRASPADVTTALERVARHNAYFVIDTSADPSADWRPAAELFGPGIDRLLAGVAARLGHDDTKVVASVMFQGYAARLWSPTLAAVVEHGILPELTPAAMSWRYLDGEPIGLRLAPVTGWTVGSTAVADVYQTLVAAHLAPLVSAVRSRVRISERLLWGNAASALAGAARVVGPASTPLRTALLTTGHLAGTLEPGTLARRSCCLFYRIPGGGTCGDCVLRRRA